MRRVLPVCAALLLATLALGGARAHLVDFSQSKIVTAGPYSVTLDPKPTNVYANSTLTIAALLSRTADGLVITNVPCSLNMTGTGYAKSVDMEPDGTGYWIAGFVLPRAGNYTATLLVKDSNATYTASTSFFAYPDIPVRLRAADASSNSFVGESSPLLIETVDPIRLERIDVLTDLEVRVEHWSDDHKVLYGSEDVALVRVSPGLWKHDYVFPTTGMYHLNFSSRSGGFALGDAPVMHTYVTEDPGGSQSEKRLPLPPWASFAALLLAAALAAAVPPRRPRARG